MKRINLPKSKKAKLRQVFGVSNVTVWSALNYVTDSNLAKKIRNAALVEGGTVEHRVVVPEGFMPNCETYYESDADGRVRRIVQTFLNGVRVELDNDMCTAALFRGERLIKTYENVVLQEWGNIVFEAQNLANSLCK